MKACSSCGTDTAPIRIDGECFRCHVRGIGFTFAGGAFYGKAAFHTTEREYLAEHVGDVRSDAVERAS